MLKRVFQKVRFSRTRTGDEVTDRKAGILPEFIADDGTGYLPIRWARPWGEAGCPLVPRLYREAFGNQSLPPRLQQFLQGPTTLSELGPELLSDDPQSDLPDTVVSYVVGMLDTLPLPYEAVVVPAGVPSHWLRGLPVRTRTANVLRRVLEGRQTLEAPLTVGDLMAQRNFGFKSLLDLACVMESVESTTQSEVPTPQLSVATTGDPKPAPQPMIGRYAVE